MKFRVLLLLCFCSLAFQVRLIAQIKATPIDIHFESFNTKNGLSQGYVSSIIQDKQGFMWFATNDGLNRYDSYRIKVFRLESDDSLSLPANSVSQLAEDIYGNFWVGTRSKGLVLFDRTHEHFLQLGKLIDSSCLAHDILQLKFYDSMMLVRSADDYCLYKEIQSRKFIKVFSYKEQFRSHLNTSILKEHQPDYNHTYWIRDGKILRLYDDSLYVFTPSNAFKNWTYSVYHVSEFGMEHQEVFSAHNGYDDHTTVFIGTNRLVVYDFVQHKILFQQSYENKNLSDNFYWYNKPFEGRRGEIFFCTMDASYSFDSKHFTFKSYHSTGDGSFQGISRYIDRDGVLWIGTGGYGLYKYNSATERFNRHKEEVNSFAQDAKGRIYVSFRNKGSYIFNPISKDKEPMIPLSISKNDKDQMSLLGIDERNQLWYYILFKSVNRYDMVTNANSNVNKITPDSIISFGYPYFFFDRDQSIWQLFYRHDNRRVLFHSDPVSLKIISQSILPIPPDLNSQNSFLTCHYQDRKGSIWFGSVNGLWQFNIAKQIWKQILNNPSDSTSISSSQILSICEDPIRSDQYLWIGTADQGFFRYEISTGKCKRYSIKNGLANNMVYGILNDEQGNLWMSTNNGLSCFNIKNETFHNYNEEDGLVGNEFNHDQFLKAKNGDMYWGGVDGMTWFNPANVLAHTLTENKMVFSDLLLLNKRVDYKTSPEILDGPIQFAKSITIPPDKNMFSVEFALLQYCSSEKKKYQYYLEGFDENWIDNADRTSVVFTNLDAGSYTLHVKGCNSDGVWTKDGISIRILVETVWYKTWWAKLILLLLIALSIYLFYRYRLNQSIKIMNMRNVIASDLHDEIGSTISSISLYSDIIEERIKEEDIKQIAARIGGSSREIINAMSDIVWSINPKNDPFDNVVLRMKSFANEMFEAQQKIIQFHIDESLMSIHLYMNQRKNFYLIFKEAMNNIVKYANANQVVVELKHDKDFIVCQIIDDGIGFDLKEHKDGNGLHNMKNRAKELNGEFDLVSSIGNGTKLYLRFPIK